MKFQPLGDVGPTLALYWFMPPSHASNSSCTTTTPRSFSLRMLRELFNRRVVDNEALAKRGGRLFRWIALSLDFFHSLFVFSHLARAIS